MGLTRARGQCIGLGYSVCVTLPWVSPGAGVSVSAWGTVYVWPYHGSHHAGAGVSVSAWGTVYVWPYHGSHQGSGSVYRPGVQCMCDLTVGLTRDRGQCIGLGYSVCVTLPWVSPGAGFSVSAWGTVYVWPYRGSHQGPGSVYRPGVQCMCDLTMGLTRGRGQCIGLGYSVCVTLPWVSPGAGVSVSAWGTVYVWPYRGSHQGPGSVYRPGVQCMCDLTVGLTRGRGQCIGLGYSVCVTLPWVSPGAGVSVSAWGTVYVWPYRGSHQGPGSVYRPGVQCMCGLTMGLTRGGGQCIGLGYSVCVTLPWVSPGAGVSVSAWGTVYVWPYHGSHQGPGSVYRPGVQCMCDLTMGLTRGRGQCIGLGYSVCVTLPWVSPGTGVSVSAWGTVYVWPTMGLTRGGGQCIGLGYSVCVTLPWVSPGAGVSVSAWGTVYVWPYHGSHQGRGSVYRPGVQCMCDLTVGLTRGRGQCIGLGYSVCVTLPWVSPGTGVSVSAWGTVYVWPYHGSHQGPGSVYRPGVQCMCDLTMGLTRGGGQCISLGYSVCVTLPWVSPGPGVSVSAWGTVYVWPYHGSHQGPGLVYRPGVQCMCDLTMGLTRGGGQCIGLGYSVCVALPWVSPSASQSAMSDARPWNLAIFVSSFIRNGDEFEAVLHLLTVEGRFSGHVWSSGGRHNNAQSDEKQEPSLDSLRAQLAEVGDKMACFR